MFKFIFLHLYALFLCILFFYASFPCIFDTNKSSQIVNKMLKMRSSLHFYHPIFKSICLFIHLLLLIVQQSNIT